VTAKARIRICAHDQIERSFADVLQALPALLTKLGATVRPLERPGADFTHRGMARLAVQVDGVDMSVLVYRLVGGTQAPVTEVAFAVTGEPAPQAAAVIGRAYLDAVMRALQPELQPAHG
jgi:hypothetical protein